MRRLCFLLFCSVVACDSGPTWHQDIAPLVDRSCSGCHEWNEFSAPAKAQAMLAMVDAGRMPPWLPGPDSLPFSNDPRLTKPERDLLAKWAQNPQLGSPRPRPERAPAEPFETSPYLPTVEASDEIRCFVLRPRPGFVIGYHWLGTSAHHYSADVVAAEHVGRALAKERIEGQGWDCRDAQLDIPTKTGLISTTPFAPFAYPSGYGVELKEGDALILNVHLLPQQVRQPTRFGIALSYSSTPVAPVVQVGWSAPADLPCPPAMAAEPQCQRAYAEQRALWGVGIPDPKEHVMHCEPQGFGPEQGGLFPVRGACTEALPPGRWRLLGVRAHTHLLGRSMRILVKRSSGDWQMALDIPRWNYRYELTAAPAEPIEVSGSVRIECDWDNGPATQVERPRYRIFGLGREDNMCVGSVSLGEL